MSLSKQALDALRSHWAVNAIGVVDLERAERLVSERLADRGRWRTDLLFVLLEPGPRFLA